MKNLIFILLSIKFAVVFSQQQPTLLISAVKLDNGLYKLNNELFSGKLIQTNLSGQITSDFDVKKGLKSGWQRVYFEEPLFTRSLFLDTHKINNLLSEKKDIESKINGLLKDTTEIANKLKSLIIVDIGGYKNLQKLILQHDKKQLKQKKLNSKKQELYVKYFDFVVSKNDLDRKIKQLQIKLIDNDSEITKEQIKPKYVPKLKEEFEVIENKKTGNYSSYFTNGNLQINCSYQDDFKEGRYISYFENGSIQDSGYYHKNEMDGIWKTYYGNYSPFSVKQNQIKEVLSYKEGIKDGIEQTYFEDGTLSKSVFYNNGQLNGVVKTFFPNGNTKTELSYLNSKKNGIGRLFNENGILLKEEMYKNDKLQGKYKEYFSSGKIKIEATKDTNSIVDYLGKYTEYFENGKIKTQLDYKEDGNSIDIKPKTVVTFPDAVLNKKYECKCCRKMINGIFDGVSKDGSKLTKEGWRGALEGLALGFDYQGLTYSEWCDQWWGLSGYELLGKDKKTYCQDFWIPRYDYAYCSMKCVNICYK